MAGMFWQLTAKNTQGRLIYNDQVIDYIELEQKISDVQHILPIERELIALVANSSLNFIVYYLALLRTQHVVLLVDPSLSDTEKHALYDHYQVNAIITEQTIQPFSLCKHQLAIELSVLLSTSGSTGSPKLVKLSKANLTANCASICEFLPIKSSDVAMTFLPLSYSFGLSILHSHLARGATIVIQNESPMSARFWQQFQKFKVNSFYGVPFSFQLLIRLGLEKLPLQKIRYMAQAGGKLLDKQWQALAQYTQANNVEFYTMYGQTEATARIAYLPAEHFVENINVIGLAIPNTSLHLIDEEEREITALNTSGELCMVGDNVFGGYATISTELSSFSQNLPLKTGDIAQRLENGFYQIVGRSKRICKLAGKRINLDEIQSWISTELALEIICTGCEDSFIAYVSEQTNVDIKKLLADKLKCHSRLISVVHLKAIPRLSNGKVDYHALN
ncbi:AMP-binding protein [Pseudoalteromonas sp. SWN29]|uniref:AMP-binding protein n=1 Tax=Pseudoalteromonas sp. SWN29 TaxID=2792064 RepID=UPI0018CE4D4B|nr:AMP-binding protein [Pseudoalteromonas sp. SWN29]MBH0028983.1 AMP-binding protein [Pseudoalteromonas sp. SWN29]